MMANFAVYQSHMTAQYFCDSLRKNLFLYVLINFAGSKLIDFKCAVMLDDFGSRKITRPAYTCICRKWNVTS